MRTVGLLLAAALLIAACTSEGDTRTDPDPDPEDAPSALDRLEPAPTTSASDAEVDRGDTTSQPDTPDEPVPAPEPTADLDEAVPDGVAAGLVLVQDFDSPAHLASYEPDGDLVAVYVEDDGTLAWLPIWAPDGRSVAWASTDDTVTWSLIVAATDGSDSVVYDLPGRPDYLTFDPTASRVLALTPTAPGYSLVIVELDGGSREVIDTGDSYFTDFAPDGERVVGHVGTEMRITTTDGSTEPLGFDTSRHQTPVWHPDGERLLFTNEVDGPTTLVTYETETGATSDLGTFGDFVLFSVDPTGERVAVSTFESGTGAAADASTAAMRSGLWVVELTGGATTLVSASPTTAPLWDPTGTRLLVRDSAAGVGTWTAYGLNGEELASVRRNINASLMPNYLPFWDQFVRSQTLWSPTGDRFVHVGADESGRAGVWIHDVDRGGESRFLVEGQVAFWSPT